MLQEQWVDSILNEFFRLMHQRETGNFDQSRFPNNREDQFLTDYHRSSTKFFFAHQADLFRTWSKLGNAESRTFFDTLLLYRMLGPMHVRLPTNTQNYWDKRAETDTLIVGDADETGLFGNLHQFELDFLGQHLRVKAWRNNVVATFLLKQYFYERGEEAVVPTEGDHVIDAGACFGDTAIAFAVAAGRTGRIYSFDMLPAHLRIIGENLDMNPELKPRVKLFGVGLDGRSNDLPAAVPADASGSKIDPAAQLSDGDFPLRSIDDLVAAGEMERVDFIKMDIEGSELAALQGGEQSLRRFRPKLAISLYHKPEDLYTITDYLDGLELGYRFYLWHYTIHSGETVLYARAD
jgi:FkbM family methyltransferase